MSRNGTSGFGRWREALGRYMAGNDRGHRALPAGWRARLDAVYLYCSERGAFGSPQRRRQQWQDYEKS